MDNKKAKEILYDIVDGEASELEREEFEAFVQSNSELRSLYNLEMQFRGMFAEKVSEDRFPKASLSALQAKLDAIDAEPLGAENLAPEYQPLKVNSQAQPIKQVVTVRYALAMAASFVLLLVGGYATISFFGHQAAFGAFENAHYVSRNNLGNRNSMVNTSDATKFINSNFGVMLDKTIPGLELCGGEVVRLDNSDFAHFMFCDSDDNPVSIFVGSAEEVEFPDMPVTIHAGKKYFNHTCHGCELMYWRSGDALIVAATSPDKMDNRPISNLIQFANGEAEKMMSPADSE
jgi:hypothetical protein